jgi:hypothetical protein
MRLMFDNKTEFNRLEDATAFDPAERLAESS